MARRDHDIVPFADQANDAGDQAGDVRTVGMHRDDLVIVAGHFGSERKAVADRGA